MQSPPVQSINGAILAILSGYSITTWEYDAVDSDKQQPVTRYPQGDLPISSFCWNHNRLVLATCSAVSTDEHIHHNVMLISSQSGNRLDSFQHDQDWGRHGVANSLQFGGKSRYLCVGDESGAVCLWDLKKKLRVRQFFHNDHPSRQVSLDPTDTYVLSLTPFFMYVYNLRDGILVATLTPPGNKVSEEAKAVAFTKYCTTSLEPNIVAIGTSDGSVLLYDFTRGSGGDTHSRPILSFTKRHEGAVTDVAFSPTDSKLLVSSGEDGTVKIYDTTTVETIQEIRNSNVTSPITSLSLYGGDGNICAIGCESGDVFVYDLSGDEDGALLATLNVGGQVEQVAFAPPPRAKDQTVAQDPPKTPAEQRNTLPMAPTPAKFRIQETTTSVKSPSNPDSSSASTNDMKRLENVDRPTKPTYSAPFASAVRKSPLSPRRTAIVQATRQQNSSAASKSITPSSSLPPKSPTAVSSPASKDSPSGDVNTQPLAIKPKAARPSFMKTRTETMRQHLYPLRQQENIPEQPEVTQVNIDEFREVVQEEIENLQDEMEEQLRNLHMDMISQFHQQSQEMNKALSGHLATIERLTEENKRLKEENERLRRGR
ncbi:WD40 repeat-containing protein [Nitzschia inconspicua]|uniref:WD40 repeat-containing protein n=1 Tax=Nitzschia inconspicua TaxID=303405 RepID=A0A9K3L5V6_9STRA|nr:WD40 repeat-containing protein [Nitzschia inconspicua]